MPSAAMLPLSLSAAATLGLAFGLGPCLLCGLSTLGPVFLVNGVGVRRSWTVLLPYSAGRLIAYATLGLVCGLAGREIGTHLDGAVIATAFGAATLLLGFGLLPTSGHRVCDSACHDGRNSARRGLLPGGLFLTGAALALSPCAPLAAVLVAAATSASAGHGLVLGLAFGLGAIAAPALFYGVGAAYIGNRLRVELGSWLRGLRWLSAGLLLFAGLVQLLRGLAHFSLFQAAIPWHLSL